VTNHQFDANVDRWVRAEIEDGHTDFGTIVRHLPSVYPEQVMASLRRLRDKGQITRHWFADAEHETSRPPIPVNSAIASRLPLPHPLEYEWRFTDQTALDLMDLAGRLSSPGESVMLIGTPSVAATAVQLSSKRRVVFVGEDNSVTDAVSRLALNARRRVTVLTSRQADFDGTAAVVVLDPPWYADFMLPMLAAAALASRVNGYVVLAAPAVGGGPSAPYDQHRMIRVAERFGLMVEEHVRCALSYSSPFFERNALKAVGLTNVPDDWRRGDLAILRKCRRVVVPRPPRWTHLRLWSEIVLNGTRIYARRDNPIARQNAGMLVPVLPGGVLPSVSRCDPRRRLANVWTAGNRLFFCPRTDLLVVAAASLGAEVRNVDHSGRGRFTMQERDATARLSKLLQEVASTETNEAAALVTRVRTRPHRRQLNRSSA
jgi:predicted RNA methylase